MSNVVETGAYQRITASTNTGAGAAQLMGIFVASASATPTIRVYDGTDATGTVVVNTFTPVAGTYYPIPAKVAKGIYIAISGTVDCTVFSV